MTVEIDVSVSDPAWEEACAGCENLVDGAIQAVFKICPVAQRLLQNDVLPELSVVLANNDLVQTLNREYRGRDKPTNVLSFAMLDGDDGWQPPDQPGPCALGDLVLALDTLKQESLSENKPLEDHFRHLIVHGTLHLLGYDHMEDDAAEEMESLEIQILGDIGVPDPYKNI